jgi:hypothetical protein
MTDTVHVEVNKLLRGIATNHPQTVRDAWRVLVQTGPEAVGAILQKLQSTAWREAPHGPVTRYLGVLLALLDEIDSESFAAEIARLDGETLHPVHERTVATLAQRLTDAPLGFVAENVPVFVANDVPDRDKVLLAICRWSETWGLKFETVTRVSVIARHGNLEYLGRYDVLYSGIILTWPVNAVGPIKRWFQRLETEWAFYHEAGHHACGHLEGGQIAQQEAEADAFAIARFRCVHPVMTAIGLSVAWPVRGILRRLDTPLHGTEVKG